MNYERSEDDSWTCEDCGNFPEVGFSLCDCKLERVSAYRESHKSAIAIDYGEPLSCGNSVPDTKLKYEFIVHQTDKAILFALKGEHGIYQQWIPRSVITAQTEKKVSVKSWFAKRFV